ncbi:MAG: GDP-L-fucose synthase [Candidatus Vogelbacteria bacterium]|nr:GDP-L-fucose synthase [Candidatus Vogelbacteria bacterium]
MQNYKLGFDKRIYIAGHKGMFGSAIVRLFQERGYKNLILKSSKELDLGDAVAVKNFFDKETPQVVILAAARVGGIQANLDAPAEFLYENLMIQNNVIHQSYLHGVEKFCFLGSSCIYPRECAQPMKEEYLLGGPLEPTNEGYALAKVCGLKMVELYRKQYKFPGISLMPCNLYGTNDSFDPIHSHVLSALVKKMVDAVEMNLPSVSLWGTGIAKREFMHVDDAADAVLYFLDKEIGSDLINIGWGEDISIKDLAIKIAEFAGYNGELVWDKSKPDGMLRKCMDVSRMKNQGFVPKIPLDAGIQKTIEEYGAIMKKSARREQ